MLYKYFIEIKNRLVLLSIAWFLTGLSCYNYKETLLFFLIKLNSMLYFTSPLYFITTDLLDLFNVYLKLSFFLSFQVIILKVLYHIAVFFNTALFTHEFSMLKYYILLSIISYFITLIIFNFYVLPNIWLFFLSYQTCQFKKGLSIFFESQILYYTCFYLEFCWLSIYLRQVFVLVFSYLRCIKNKITYIKKTRKLTYTLFFLVSTIITPPDIISQIVTSLLLILIYEFIIVFTVIKTLK